MKYPDLITSLSQKTNLTKRDTRAVLKALPEALRELHAGEHVVTPVGTFIAKYREKRPTHLPGGGTGERPEQIYIRLKVGVQMKTYPTDPQWDQLTDNVSPSPSSSS